MTHLGALGPLFTLGAQLASGAPWSLKVPYMTQALGAPLVLGAH